MRTFREGLHSQLKQASLAEKVGVEGSSLSRFLGRRFWRSITLGLVVALAFVNLGVLAQESEDDVREEAIDIGSRLELFVDRHLIDTMDGARLRMHKPEHRDDLVGFPKDVDYLTVIYEEDRGLYRLYYRKPGNKYLYAESKDGKNWEKPDLTTDISANNDAEKNLLIKSHNLSPFLDTRPGVPEKNKYKAISRGPIFGEGTKRELYALASEDGIHWGKLKDEPILEYNQDLHGKHAFDSQNVAFWSETEQRYVLFFRHFAAPGGHRSIGRAVSENFLDWEDESARFEPANFSGEDLYTNQTHPYFRAPHLYISLPTRFTQDRVKGEHVGDNLGSTDIMFMTLRAGADAYARPFKEAFIRPGLAPERWKNRANYVAQNVVPTGAKEMSIYHKDGSRYVLRTDGFASVYAPFEGGEVITKPLIFEGDELVCNLSTAIRGGVRVELQNADGEPLPGFTLEDCDPIFDDTIERTVSWKNGSDVGQFAGKLIRIRFQLQDSDIYSFTFRDAD